MGRAGVRASVNTNFTENVEEPEWSRVERFEI
jgi:hypothetical protein